MTISSNQQDSPLDALLASYAVGNVSRPLHALVASHLMLKSDNRAFVAAMEETLGGQLENIPVQNTVGRNRDQRLSAIFDGKQEPFVAEKIQSSALIPAPLAAYLDRPFEELKWRNVIPGLREVKLEDNVGCEASLLWIKAGRAMPSHTHEGIEATLVLQGSFIDHQGEYARGDLAVVDSSIDHKPVASRNEDCICFAVSEGPVHLTGPLARIFNWMKRH